MLKFSFKRGSSKGYRKIFLLHTEGNSESEKHTLWSKYRCAFPSNMKAAVQRIVLQIRYLSHTDLSSKNIHLANKTY